ncbi:MAG: molybdate transport system substrate-binding protein [Actinomycetota bacterium]|jgi:molybdate transport system substrate-binding protein|nr:molybdate transport system substrate-binding protein [Actinomycetota bacterium]
MSASRLLPRTFRWRHFTAIGALLLSFGIAACGDSGKEGSDRKLTVFAAASLTEAFTELGRQYEGENEGTEVEFSFAASSELAAQIDQGAPADLFASADQPNMEKVVDSGMADGAPVTFAGNLLEIAVPKGNPGNVQSLGDLEGEGLIVAVCDFEVPCGNAAREVLGKAGVEASVDSYEPDVKSVLTKVELDEVDAGLVYHSDVIASGDRIESIPIPGEYEVINRYPIVAIKGAGNEQGAEDFIELVLSKRGQAVLEERGFLAP